MANDPAVAKASGKANGNGNGDIHHPRPRLQQLNRVAKEDGAAVQDSSPTPPPLSRVGTPAPPDDAPPSVKATSAVRKELRKTAKDKRIFPSVEYKSRLSYFDPQSDYGNFRGFFVLFWIGLAIMVITAMLRNYKETGSPLNWRQWPLLVKNVRDLAVSDALMAVSTGLDLPLHFLYKNSKGSLRWERRGIIVQSIFQMVWLGVWIVWPFMRDWTWTAQVFFTLHCLVLFMKLHSYAFYSGHLSATLNRLKELDMPIGPATPTTAAVKYPSAHPRDNNPDEEIDKDENISPIFQLRNDLAKELTSPLGNVTYPQNLTVLNFADYMLCPTLCYELEYPRTPKRSYLELFYKTLAVFGCIFLMTVTSEEFIIPVLDESSLRLRKAKSASDASLIFAETVSSLLFPFMVVFLLVFLSIFEYTLGAFAEITQFADRRFFSDWWNSQDWLEFSREWNIPVHNFLLRHVYAASRGVKMSKAAATALTFFLSAIAHELIMGCITRKFRGYGFVLMMFQIPFVAVQKLPFVRRQALLNNIIFWICMILGLSLLCALYVLV